jgi:hypothetical protein
LKPSQRKNKQVVARLKPWILLLLGGITWVGLVVFQIEFAFGFAGTAVLGLLAIGPPVLFAAGLAVGFIWKHWGVAWVTGGVLVVCWSSMLVGQLISRAQRTASIGQAEKIIDAAERYRAARSTYPTTLDALVPEFLPAEPRTKMGLRERRFTFQSTPESYSLDFEIPGWEFCVYDSKALRWSIRD